MKIETTIYVEPVAKERPRVAFKGGKRFVYTPTKTVHAENLIRQALLDKGFFDEGIPLRLEAIFYRQRPKTLPKKVTLPVKAPDLDNYAKTLKDALEKFVFYNDAQIVDLYVRKRFGSPPRIELKISSDNFEEV